MAIAKMKKIYLIAHQAEKDQVLSILQQSGVVEISDVAAKDAGRQDWTDLVEGDQAQDELQELEARLGDIRFALDFLHRHHPAKKSLLDSLGGTKPAVAAEDFTAGAGSLAEVARGVYSSLRVVDEKLIALRNEETRLHNLKTQLAPWDRLTAPLEEIRTTPAARTEIGTMAAADLGALRQELAAAAPAAFVEEIKTDRGEAYLFLAYPASMSEEVQGVLKQHGFNRQVFQALSGTPTEILARIEQELEGIAAQRTAILAKAGEEARHRDSLNRYYDYLTMERDKKQVVASFARTVNSFVAEGWIREKDLPLLTERLAACETVEVSSRDPLEGEAFPVALENRKMFAPFEFITKLYGTPSPYGLDPTPALTPFFIIFFGLCMTDAGYGVVIALLAALGLWKVKGSESVRRLLWVLFAGGISTIVFGWLVGGWFGAEILGAPLAFSSLNAPLQLLMYAFALGIIQIFFGMAIQAWRNISSGKILDAVFDQGLWYALIIGLLLFAVPADMMPSAAGIGKIMAIVGAAGLILTQGRTQPTIIKKFLSGLLSLYNITGYLSDVLSYSRLLALGLATGVIALAINTMAGLLKGHPIGFVVMVFMLIGGHAFNLILNTLGSYIHSSRLQYIEFYNRFYEGGGRAFVPFKLNTRHVEVLPKWQDAGRTNS